MTTTSPEATDSLLNTYYDVLTCSNQAFDDQLRPLLASDLVFEGPLAGRVVGAERFIVGVGGFIATLQELKMLQRVHETDRAAALYDARMPGGTVRFAEFFRVEDGRISSLQLLYNGQEYIEKGGR